MSEWTLINLHRQEMEQRAAQYRLAGAARESRNRWQIGSLTLLADDVRTIFAGSQRRVSHLWYRKSRLVSGVGK